MGGVRNQIFPYQGQVLGRELAELIREIGIERVEIFHGHREMLGVVNEALAEEKETIKNCPKEKGKKKKDKEEKRGGGEATDR